jgi:hypothetical protein
MNILGNTTDARYLVVPVIFFRRCNLLVWRFFSDARLRSSSFLDHGVTVNTVTLSGRQTTISTNGLISKTCHGYGVPSGVPLFFTMAEQSKNFCKGG